MKLNKLLFTAIATSFFLGSCSDDNSSEAPLGSYDNGVLVLNEGDAVSGSVTFVSDDLQTVQQNIFPIVNGTSESVGGYVQSIFFDGDRAFIISNGSNKITVVNRYTFQYIQTISTGLSVPRYGAVLNGKAYVTNLAGFGSSTDDYIAVIDLATMTVGEPIAIHDYADHIIVHNNKLIVANGSFGSGDSVMIIDPATNSIGEFSMDGAPNSFEISGNMLYVMCSTIGADSKLVTLDLTPDAIIDIHEIVLPASIANAQNLDVDGNNIYFTAGSKIYSVSKNATEVIDSALADTGSTSFYIGYGFAVHDGKIYISEGANDFVSDGRIFVYSTDGELMTEIPSGLGPNGFYFND
jgi:hypothetical protein